MSKQQSKLDELEQALEDADVDVEALVGGLEQYEQQTVSRRGLLGAGAGAAGAAALSQLAVGKARAGAGSQSVGGIGTASNPVDIVAEDIFPPGGSGSGNSTFIEKIETATIVDDDTGTVYDVGDDLAGGGGAGGGPTYPTVTVEKDGTETVGTDQSGTEISRSTDAQTVLQSVADHLLTNGGGTLYIRRGEYSLSGYNSTTLSYIDFGSSYSGSDVVPIQIIGEGAGTGTNGSDLSTNAVTFKVTSDNAEANVVDVFSFGGNVANSGTMRNIHPHVRGITILTPNDPNIRGIDANNAVCAEIENCIISPDVTVANISEPTSSSQGILLPQVSNHANVRVRQCVIFGMYYGIGYADHARLEQTNFAYCKIALLANTVQNTAMFDGVTVEGCEYLHFFNGAACNVTGDMCIEFYNKGGWNDRATFDVATGSTPGSAGPISADSDLRMSIDYIQITPSLGAEHKAINTTNGGFTLDQRWNQIHPTPAPSAINPDGSPFSYTNNDGWDQMVTVSGGSVSDISLRAQSTGLTGGTFEVHPGETLNVTYSSAPTMYKFAR